MRIVVLLVLLFIATPSYAAGDLKMSDICTPSKIPPGGSAEIDPRKLVGQILKAANVADIDLDPDGGEVPFAMKREAIVDPRSFCTTTRRCSDDTRVQLGVAFIRLRKFIADNNKPRSPENPGFEILRTRDNVTGEITPRELMDSNFTGLSARCVAAAKKDDKPNDRKDGADDQDKGKEKAKADEPQLRVMVRKKVTDLSTLQSDDGFKGLDRATFSLSSDYLKHSSTYNIDGVVGVGLSKFHPSANIDADLIAYVLYSRQFIAGQAPKNSKEVNNIGGGLADNFLVDSALGTYNLQWSAQYLESQVSDGRLWSTSLAYTPLTGPFIGRAEYFGPFAVVLLPQLKFTHGQVIDHGIDPTFVANKDFDRVGGHLEAVVYFDSINPDLAWFKGFSWRNIYDFYYGITGFYHTIERFESKLSYKFPDQQFWSIDLDYINGRNLDTLERQKQLTLGVGFKY